MNKIDRTIVGDRLKKLRGDKTQKAVAKAIGVTDMAISQYENGMRIPNDTIKIKLANYYGKSVESIFFEA